MLWIEKIMSMPRKEGVTVALVLSELKATYIPF